MNIPGVRSALRGTLFCGAALWLFFAVTPILANYRSLDPLGLDLVVWVVVFPPILTLRVYWIAIPTGAVLGLLVPEVIARIASPIVRQCCLLALASLMGIPVFHAMRLALDWELPPPTFSAWLTKPTLLFCAYCYVWLALLSARMRVGCSNTPGVHDFPTG